MKNTQAGTCHTVRLIGCGPEEEERRIGHKRNRTEEIIRRRAEEKLHVTVEIILASWVSHTKRTRNRNA